MKIGFELQHVELMECSSELSKQVSIALRGLGIFPDVVLVLQAEEVVGYLVLHHGAYVGSVAVLDISFRPVVNRDISSDDMLECYGGKMSSYYQLVHSCLESAGYRISMRTDCEFFGNWLEKR